MSTETAEFGTVPVPSEELKALGILIGTWRISGGAEGTVKYRWMEGGFFLIQEVDLVQNGDRIIGFELIGHLRPFGEPQSVGIMSRFYDNKGNTLDYEYELVDKTLFIWAGAKGSPAYFRGEFTADGLMNEGSWVYPGGYGYDSSMAKIAD